MVKQQLLFNAIFMENLIRKNNLTFLYFSSLVSESSTCFMMEDLNRAALVLPCLLPYRSPFLTSSSSVVAFQRTQKRPILHSSIKLKVTEHSFRVPMPNSPLLLNYLCFGANFLHESRLIADEFILAFWLRCVRLPW